METAVIGASLDAGVRGATRWMVGTIPMSFPASVAEFGCSRHLLVTCDTAKMGDNFDSRTPALAAGSATNKPSGNGGAVVEGVCVTRARLYAAPLRRFADLRQEASDPASISDASAGHETLKRYESSRIVHCALDDSAARHKRLEVSGLTADTSAAERLEKSSLATVDDSAASPKRLEMSGSSVDTSAAERLEKSSLATVDDSAADNSHWSREFADGTPVGQTISRAIGDELGEGTYLPECWSTLLAAHTAPTSVITDELATAASSVAPNLAAGVNTGPSGMEGACTIGNSRQMKFNRRFCMVNWNDLLETKDQLGPIPSFWNNSITGADSQNFKLPILQFGSSLTDDIVECMQRQGLERFVPVLSNCVEESDSDLESTITSETLTSDGDPVIFCGMGRIARDHSESSDPEPPKRRNRSSKPSGRSRRGAVHHKAKKNGANYSSYGCKVNVNSLKRESSEIPGGGWFRARTVAPSSDSSSSSSESSESSSELSSSDDEKESGSRRKLGVSRGVKIKTPFTFDGRADLDDFDQWTYEVDTWREWNGVSERRTLKILVNFMSGKASRFFMKHVALRQKDWTLKLVYEALFNYCFAPDFKLQLREQLTSTKQGNDDVRDIETLAVRFPDVTERQLRQIFWNGIRTYLRMHLIEKGLDPERSSLRKMVKYASRREAAKKTLRREQKESGRNFNLYRGGRQPVDGNNGRSSTPSNGNEHGQHSGGSLHESDEERDSDPPEDKSNDSVEFETDEKQPKAQNRVLLSQEEFLRLRREGRCFNCKERGHLSQECPENNDGVEGHLGRDCTGEEEEEILESNAVHVDETSSEEISESEAETQSNADNESVTVAEAVDSEGQETYSEGNSSEESYRSYEYPNEGLSESSEEF
ncbi:hypothetical protein B0H19DRAFT_1384656 [Mycena capillaripes]|nr:hypothetical protein B0H19DRAFT_1384656 [Mycena capillaripes]